MRVLTPHVVIVSTVLQDNLAKLQKNRDKERKDKKSAKQKERERRKKKREKKQQRRARRRPHAPSQSLPPGVPIDPRPAAFWVNLCDHLLRFRLGCTI